MSGDVYQKAKAYFTDLVDLDRQAQDARLDELAADSPELAREVRSLLNYHTDQSLVVPPASPKIRTKSTLATTYQTKSFRWFSAPLRSLAVSLPFLLAGLVVTFWVEHLVHQRLELSVTARLTEKVEYRRADFLNWEKRELQRAVEWSRDAKIKETVCELVELTKGKTADSEELQEALKQSDATQRLQRRLQDLLSRPVKFAVWDRRLLTIADWNQAENPEVLGEFVTPSGASMLTPVLRGDAKIFLPTIGKTVTAGYEMGKGEPILSAFVPVYDGSNVVAALMVRGYGLEESYAKLIESWESVDLEETYLINSRGTLLTKSRYGDALENLGLAMDEMGPRPAPIARDPGSLLTRGGKSPTTAATWPPTVLARQVISGNNGIDVDGYRNYVGERVVGTWRWLPDHEIGLAVEQDYSEAFGLSAIVRNALLGLTSLFSLGIFGISLFAGFRSSGRRRLKDLSEVGPYQVQELLGEGGMGRVYLAEHALLCRQSAVKVLTKGLTDLSVISRFEREVQLASQLTHPNTISIFDFGRNKDGVFYYAMEYINGAHLGQLVEYSGPIEPGRCIYILRQLCRALLEAHQAGVVHRDIKPQNIMVCDRGGEPDFVKLFDYGLVKAFAPGVSHNPSQTRVVVGTPRFMAPERLNSPWLADPRVDIYSVGALAYYLLTGQLPPLVTPDDGMDDQQTGVETLDLPIAVVEFGELLSVCMAVEPSTRPSNMSSLMRELDELSEKFPWTREDSKQWWSKHESKLLMLVRSKRKKLEQEQNTHRNRISTSVNR